MIWRRVDRTLVLLAASTLAATVLVVWLTPYGPLDHRACGMDAPFYLSNLAAWFFLVRWSWRAIKFLQAAAEGWLAGAGPPVAGPDLAIPSKQHPA